MLVLVLKHNSYFEGQCSPIQVFATILQVLLQGGEFADKSVCSMENTSDPDDLLVTKAVTKGYLHCN